MNRWGKPPAGDDPFHRLMRRHPCLSPEAHGRSGRIHLPVSPNCNIQCRFCERRFHASDRRPGVARRLVTPGEALDVVARAMELCPELAVAGVAGPGESLATSHALDALEAVLLRFPDLIGCLSTNGLNLPERAGRMAAIGVRTVTVTVNALTPTVWGRVYAWIKKNGRKLEGEEAASVLTTAQERGIKRASALGLVVKVNTVLVPGVNEGEIERIASWAAHSGASIMNVMPLLPGGEMSGFAPPGCRTIEAARRSVEKYLPVFRHCLHCRADACGIPGLGKDFSAELYGESPRETFSHG